MRATFEFLMRGETIGIFQVESGGMTDVVRKKRSRTGLKKLLRSVRFIVLALWMTFLAILPVVMGKKKSPTFILSLNLS